jgi:hypothetical protein
MSTTLVCRGNFWFQDAYAVKAEKQANSELLEALNKICRCAESYRQDGCRPDEWTLEEWVRWGNAAIAKAEVAA